ncbi:MAG: hypothetical protein ACFFB3_15750 [Candidatus Hodarchaeota archaeon]
MEIEDFMSLKERFADQLMALTNVTSVGIGRKVTKGEETEEMAVVVGVMEKIPDKLLKTQNITPIPETLEGIKTDVIQVGEIRALPIQQTDSDRVRRIRPAKGGFSLGNVAITAGTFGCVVYRDSEPFILSNAHVLTPDATEPEPAAREIVQPGIYDGGSHPDDYIAELADYEVIHPMIKLSDCRISQGTAGFLNVIARGFRRQTRFQAIAHSQDTNLVDAAICRPTNQDLIDPAVEDVGIPTGNVVATIGQPVVKSGRTTGTTRGEIKQVGVSVNVNYGFLTIARLRDQILIKGTGEFPFSKGGDSGSIIFRDDGEQQVTGLLFAGNDEENVTIANKIENVLELLNVTLVS